MNSGNPMVSTGGYLTAGKGHSSWFFSSDHKRVGMTFLVLTSIALLLGTLFSILVTIKALGGRGLSPRTIFEALTYGRVLLVLWFLVPAVPAGLGLFLLPIHLGARNLALPGLSRWSLSCYALGLLLIILSLILGPVGTGWTLSPALLHSDLGAVWILATGLFLLGLSWFGIGVNFLVTVHHGRREGMGFFDMSVLAWSLYLAGYHLVVSGLGLAVILLYLAASLLSGKGIFGPEADPLLWANYFAFAANPVVFYSLIPGVGVVSEILAGIGRKTMTGYRLVVGSLIALTALGILGWGAELGSLGLDQALAFVHSSIGLLAAVPVALIAYCWLATLHQGANRFVAPVTMSLAFMFHAGMACLAGLMLMSPGLGDYLGTTMFASARLDYLVWGGGLGALLAGLLYWWPKMTGLNYQPQVAQFGSVLYVAGLNLALVPRLIMGTRGVAQDMDSFLAGPTALAETSALGWLVMFAGVAVISCNFFASTWNGSTAGANPWRATSPEWEIPSPPPQGNFE